MKKGLKELANLTDWQWMMTVRLPDIDHVHPLMKIRTELRKRTRLHLAQIGLINLSDIEGDHAHVCLSGITDRDGIYKTLRDLDSDKWETYFNDKIFKKKKMVRIIPIDDLPGRGKQGAVNYTFGVNVGLELQPMGVKRYNSISRKRKATLGTDRPNLIGHFLE